MEIYIVTKTFYIRSKHPRIDLKVPVSINEAVFDTEDKANRYILQRKALNDRDDRGCEFEVEPWHVTQ